MDNNQLFVEYYKEWVSIYKEGAIRPITLSKYKMAISWLEKCKFWLNGAEFPIKVVQRFWNNGTSFTDERCAFFIL